MGVYIRRRIESLLRDGLQATASVENVAVGCVVLSGFHPAEFATLDALRTTHPTATRPSSIKLQRE